MAYALQSWQKDCKFEASLSYSELLILKISCISLGIYNLQGTLTYILTFAFGYDAHCIKEVAKILQVRIHT